MMLGRSGPKPVIGQKIHVATVTFEILEEGSTKLNAYDYREGLKGHTSANIIIDDKPYNILVKPNNPTLIIK